MSKLIRQNWNRYRITTPEQMEELFNKDEPIYAGIDTETDGVFQMTAMPFLVIFGWYPKDYTVKKRTVVCFEPTKELLQTMNKLAKKTKYVFMHNMKFDMHVLENFGVPFDFKKIYDTMAIARLSLEAKAPMAGGPRLALKTLADKYIEKNSSDEQKEIKKYKREIQRQIAQELDNAILELGYEKKEWYKTKLEAINNDPIKDIKKIVPKRCIEHLRGMR